MTQDEIIYMARKAGFSDHYLSTVQLHDLENFAALVAAHAKSDQINLAYQQGYEEGSANEREACAKVCDELQNDAVAKYFDATAGECAAAIRARGE